MKHKQIPIRIIFLICLLFCRISSSAQLADNADPYSLGIKLIKNGNYLFAVDSIKRLREIHQKAAKNERDSMGLRSYDYALALFTSFIGEEYNLNNKENQVIDPEEVQFLEAIPLIIKQAKTRQIVMVNENHNVPKHRLLTFNLLDSCYKMGYRYLAVEALIPQIPHKFDLNYPSAYTLEPNMANMLKKAIDIGYELVAYESEDTTNYNSKRPYLTRNLRELNQANKLHKIFIDDPGAKVLVHAGHGHIWEHGNKDLITMAEFFKVLSGIDPLTINQSVNNVDEFRSKLDKSPDLKRNDMPYVVLNEHGIPRVSIMDNIDDYDLLVAWPTPKQVYGRDDYMLAKNGCTQLIVNIKESDIGRLLQIRDIKAEKNSIPIDQFIIKRGTKKITTSLPAGTYEAQLMSSKGLIIWTKKIIVK